MQSQTSNLARNKFQLIAILVILFLYLISQFMLLDKPGLQQDEAIFIVPSMELAYGKGITFGSSVNLLGIHYPTMNGPYTGNSLTIPVALVTRVFGFDLALVRLLWIIVGAGTIFFTFLVCRELFNDWLALMASLLLAVNPTFWMFTHVGAHASTNMTLDIMASLFFFLCFLRTRKRLCLFAAMFMTGHGIYTKMAFGYFLIAYLIAFLYLLGRKKLSRDILNWSNLFISIMAFLLGAWPLLYQLATNASTLNFLKTALLGTPVSGNSNLDVLENFMTRIDQTQHYLLEGHAPIDMLVAGTPVEYNLILPYIFVGSVIFLLAILFLPGQRVFAKGRIAFVLMVFFLFQVLTIFTPSTLNYGVYTFIPPFSAIILALSFYSLFQILYTKWHTFARAITVVGFAFLVYTESSTLLSQYVAVDKTGGRGVWSSAIFRLNDYLLQQHGQTPVALDWGLDSPVYVLSNLQIRPSSSYTPFTAENGSPRLWIDTPPVQFVEEMEALIYQPSNIYLVRNERYAAFKGRLDSLRETVVSNGGELVKIHSIFESDGTEFIQVYEVRWPQGRPPILGVDGIPLDSPLRKDHPEITAIYPDRSIAGVRFNEQPSGESAISVVGKRFSPLSVIFFNDQPLVTFYGSEELLTALVPDQFLNLPGEIQVSVISHGRFKSNTMILMIAPKP